MKEKKKEDKCSKFISRSEQMSTGHNILSDINDLKDNIITDEIVKRIKNYINMGKYKTLDPEQLISRRRKRLKGK